MNTDLSELAFVLDRSGSRVGVAGATIEVNLLGGCGGAGDGFGGAGAEDARETGVCGRDARKEDLVAPDAPMEQLLREEKGKRRGKK